MKRVQMHEKAKKLLAHNLLKLRSVKLAVLLPSLLAIFGIGFVSAQSVISSISFEAESGSLSSASVVADNTAANGQAVVFNSQTQTSQWAFEDNFDYGAPTSPAQNLLPRLFDYNVTHRTHPSTPDGISSNGSYGTFPGDHDEDCTFDGTNNKQHTVGSTTHRSNTTNPDESFFICNNHMMSSMGEVEGYSVTTFWPRQEFDFASNGTLEWDVNLNTQSRNWYEVVIMPRAQFQIAPAIASLPIDENYPKDRIVLRFGSPAGGERFIAVSDRLPSGSEDNDRNRTEEWQTWGSEYPNDPANTDRRIRRKNRLTIENNRLIWGIQKVDGTFDDVVLNVPEGLPITRGLVEFKTHAYTPNKDEIHQRHTFHWDNIRFSGPKITPYETFEYAPVINLEGNGSVPIGSTQTVTINLPRVGNNLFIAGQIHEGEQGQVLLSINGGPNTVINPLNVGDDPCNSSGWRTFRLPVNASQLRVGDNTFRWTVGPRPSCAQLWDGFAVKALEVQMDSTP